VSEGQPNGSLPTEKPKVYIEANGLFLSIQPVKVIEKVPSSTEKKQQQQQQPHPQQSRIVGTSKL